MKSFKEQLEKDLDSVFFNMDEFAETHMIDGKEVPIVLDNDRIIELSMGKTVETRGIFTDDILFFVQKKTWIMSRSPASTWNLTAKCTRFLM